MTWSPCAFPPMARDAGYAECFTWNTPTGGWGEAGHLNVAGVSSFSMLPVAGGGHGSEGIPALHAHCASTVDARSTARACGHEEVRMCGLDSHEDVCISGVDHLPSDVVLWPCCRTIDC